MKKLDKSSEKNVYLLASILILIYLFLSYNEQNNTKNDILDSVNEETTITSSVILDPSKNIILNSPDNVVSLNIPVGTKANADKISIKIINQNIDDYDKKSNVYKFEPSGTIFSNPIILKINYDPELVGICPLTLTFFQHNDDGSLKAQIPSKEIDCENKIAVFEIDSFSFGYIGFQKETVQTYSSGGIDVTIKTFDFDLIFGDKYFPPDYTEKFYDLRINSFKIEVTTSVPVTGKLFSRKETGNSFLTTLIPGTTHLIDAYRSWLVFGSKSLIFELVEVGNPSNIINVDFIPVEVIPLYQSENIEIIQGESNPIKVWVIAPEKAKLKVEGYITQNEREIESFLMQYDLPNELKDRDAKLYTYDWTPSEVGDFYLGVRVINSDTNELLIDQDGIMKISVVSEQKCELLSGSGSNNNYKFVILVEGEKNAVKSNVRNKVINMINGGYRDIKTVTPYKNKINMKYSYLPEGDLDCGFADDEMDCDREKAEKRATQLCGSWNEIIVIPLRYLSYRGNSDFNDWDDKIAYVFKNFVFKALFEVITTSGSQYKSHTVVLSDLSPGTFWHELGHSFAGVIDYYKIDEVKSSSCSEAKFNSLMCTGYTDLKSTGRGNVAKSADAWLMLKELNKKCKAKVHTQNRNWGVFPNPSVEGLAVLIPYAIDTNGDSCQVTAEISNVRGQIVKVFATQDPPDGINYMAETDKNGKGFYQHGYNKDGIGYNFFEWDKTNQDLIPVASDTYFATVCAGNCMTYELSILGKGVDRSIEMIKIGNKPPTMPSIKGPSLADPDKNILFEFVSTDPEKDDITYQIDWGDGNIESWSTFQSSGTVYKAYHNWNYYGIPYCIKVRARDNPTNQNKLTTDWSKCHDIKIKPNIDIPSNFRAELNKKYSRIDLSWEDTSGSEDLFEIWRSENNLPSELLKTVPANTETTTDLTYKEGNTYKYAIRAYRYNEVKQIDFYSSFSNDAIISIEPSINPKCSDCGSGLLNVCDQTECESISNNCVFTDRIFPLPNLCEEIPTSTCSDKVQNGDEEGIDCGGSCPNDCVPPPPSFANCAADTDGPSGSRCTVGAITHGKSSGGACDKEQFCSASCFDGTLTWKNNCASCVPTYDGCDYTGNPLDRSNCCVGNVCDSSWVCIPSPTPKTPICGDGIIEGSEECDDNNLYNEDCKSLGFNTGTLSCDNTCKFDTSKCSNVKKVSLICGNGIVQGNEECDDANKVNGDGCSNDCKFESTCPNEVNGPRCTAEIDNNEYENSSIKAPYECPDSRPNCVYCKLYDGYNWAWLQQGTENQFTYSCQLYCAAGSNTACPTSEGWIRSWNGKPSTQYRSGGYMSERRTEGDAYTKGRFGTSKQCWCTKCALGYKANGINCVKQAFCGDGICDIKKGENIKTCFEDCGFVP